MYKEALTDIATRAIDSASADEISARFHLPRMMITGIFNMLRIHIAKMTEAEAEKILRTFFDMVDEFRTHLASKAENPVSLVAD